MVEPHFWVGYDSPLVDDATLARKANDLAASAARHGRTSEWEFSYSVMPADVAAAGGGRPMWMLAAMYQGTGVTVRAHQAALARNGYRMGRPSFDLLNPPDTAALVEWNSMAGEDERTQPWRPREVVRYGVRIAPVAARRYRICRDRHGRACNVVIYGPGPIDDADTQAFADILCAPSAF